MVRAYTFIQADAVTANLGACITIGIGSQPVMVHQLSDLKTLLCHQAAVYRYILKANHVAIILQNKYKIILLTSN